MNTTSSPLEQLCVALMSPTHHVVGLVDDLLAACQDHGLRLDWQDGCCRLRSLGGGGAEGVIDVPLRKPVFRAILARMAALCNERRPNSVSPYGGQGELSVGGDPATVFRVVFANTPDEQRLELTQVRPEAVLPIPANSTRSFAPSKRTTAPTEPLRPWWAGHRVLVAAAAAAALLLVGEGARIVSWRIASQRDDIRRLITERDQVRAELDQLRQQAKSDFPLRLTGDSANQPLDWPATLDRFYDPVDPDSVNLKRLERLGGDNVRAKIAKLRQRKPEPTAAEVLAELFRDWGGPKKR